MKVPLVDLYLQHQLLSTQITEAIADLCLKSEFILGSALQQFENNFALASGVKYAVGVSNGTDAITLALQACNITEGAEVLVPANTFIATIIGIVKAGATPILVDCHPETALIDLNLATQLITPKTKAIIPVHLYGQLCSPLELLDFSQAYNLVIIEDAAQAHLAYYQGYCAGSIGKVGTFSFYPSKNLGAWGDGGMIITNDEAIALTIKQLRNYGAAQKYYHTLVGTNSRLDNIQAMILNIKLPYLNQWNQQRNQTALSYDQKLSPISEITPIKNLTGPGHIYHLYVIKINHPTISRNQIQTKLESVGIQTGIHYPIPCHLQPGFKHLGYQKGDFPNSETLCNQILSLPIYVGITTEQITYVVDNLAQIIYEQQNI